MNVKKIGIILINIFLVLLVIPIIVFASAKLQESNENIEVLKDGSIAIPLELSKQEANIQRQKQVISEKQKIEEEFKNGKIKDDEIKQAIIDEELKIKLELIDKNTKETEDKNIDIIRKYREKELNEIFKQMNKESNQKRDVNISFNNYVVPDSEIEFYELVLDILENEKLPKEEQDILKDLLNSRYSDITNNAELKARFEKSLGI